MLIRTQSLFIASVAAGLMCAGVAHAQYYVGPYTGAGSTLQPSWQYQQKQAEMQKRAEEDRRRAQEAAAHAQRQMQSPSFAGNRYQYIPELGTYVLVQLSDQNARAINRVVSEEVPQCVKGGVGGGVVAFFRGGPKAVPRAAVEACVTNAIGN